jgi:hypothetical protein
MPLLAALCAWHDMADSLAAICVAAGELGIDIHRCMCLEEEFRLFLPPASSAIWESMIAQSPLLHKSLVASPLHLAAANGAAAAVVLLLSFSSASLDINALDSEGHTALMWSMRRCCLSVAKVLLLAGADSHEGDEAVALHLRSRKSGSMQMFTEGTSLICVLCLS